MYLNDFQKLLGDTNWIRPFLHLTADDMKPLFDILKGDSSPSSPQTLTESVKTALQLVNDKLSQVQLCQYDPTIPIYLILLMPSKLPLAVIWQNQGPLEWIHLALHQLHIITGQVELLTQLLGVASELFMSLVKNLIFLLYQC